MKLTKIKLVNFASIYSAMDLAEISINFQKKCKNKICLIVGKNGSGKTSLLSNMHPFPHLGTLDIRNGQDLIRDGMDGLKEISFEDSKGNVYNIAHHYLFKKDRSRKVMSYISLNEVELNPSGSVTNFYDIIEREFGITPAFLKIIRLGPNVADLIDNTTIERKEFFSKLLSQVDIYNEFYKRAMEESRTIKANMKMIVGKMDKLLNVPIDIAKDNLVHKQKQLAELEAEQNQLIADHNYYLGSLDPRYKNSAEALGSELTKCQGELTKINSKLSAICKITRSKDALEYDRKELAAKITELTVKTNVVQTQLTYISQSIVDVTNEIYDYENKLKLIKESSEIKDMQEQLNSLRNELATSGVPSVPYTKDDALYEAGIQQQLDAVMHELLEYPMQCIDIIKAMVMVSKHPLRDMKEEIDAKLLEINQQMSLDTTHSHKKKVHVFIIPKKCTQYGKCMYYRAVTDNMLTETPELPLDYEQELYEACSNILSIFQVINSIIQTKRSTTLGIKYDLGQFIVAYLNSGKTDIMQYIDRNIIPNALDACEDVLDHTKKQELVAKLEIELRARKAELNNDSSTTITQQLEAAQTKKATLDCERRDKYLILNGAGEDLNNAQEDLAEINEQLEGLTKKAEYEQELSDWSLKFNDVESLLTLKADVGKRISQFQVVLENSKGAVRALNKDIQDLNYFIIEYEALGKEKDTLASTFTSVELVRDAVSPGKGIPLIFIQLYLKSIQIAANNIIHDMFGPNISLNDFIVTDKEFTIPYVINGVNVSDVSMSCQGERAIITLALSFAILEQFTTKYNVLLLDEVDGPLYKENREKFFFILERQMHVLGADQVFIISHNNLFENYPVDVICTSEDADVQSGLKNVNLIWER